jgi:hypothetical protein
MEPDWGTHIGPPRRDAMIFGAWLCVPWLALLIILSTNGN